MEQKMQKKLQQFIPIARTGEHPNEINQRVITVIQKPGRPKAPIENLRPITLLSMLRKFLAICLKQHIMHKLHVGILHADKEKVPLNIFLFTKILAEKAIISQCYTIHLLMLDISKAFNKVDRAILFTNYIWARWTTSDQNHA